MDDTQTKTILIVDDDQFVTIAYKAGLEQAGYRVLVAENGEVGVRQIIETRPHLVLLDIIMPKMDGFEVLQTVKANTQVAHIPIVVFTNLTQQSDEDTAREYGAIDFLVKGNMSLNDVLLRIERLLADDTDALAQF
jgi:DNA-binding response OmpR family regulator